MSRIVYVNGAFEPEEEAKVSVFDRGFLFGDAVYEVTAVLDGRLVDSKGISPASTGRSARSRFPGPCRTRVCAKCTRPL